MHREQNTHTEVKDMKVNIEYEMAGPVQGYGMTKGSSIYTEFVVTTQDVGEMELVGGKAFNISQIAKKGIAVPQGFCITTKAYEYFMGFDGISKKDENVDDQIREAVMPPQLEEIIRDAYRRYLRGKPCAVRSSSPFEDLKRASFAGQYKSFLNVKGEKALIDAVKECWASLWSRPVVEYRKKMGIKEENMKMAVLVQEMIPAEASGVLFTEDDMVVEAVWGLGDILVGGKVIPDRFVVDRHRLTVVDKTISFKHKMSTVNKTGGVTITDTPQQLGTTAVLESDHIQELCTLGKTVETVFGCPQDIEWALCDGEFVLLQTRPISVKPSTVYSRANIAETQPGYVTYLSRVPENKPDFFVLGALPLLEKFGVKDLPENVKFLEYIFLQK
jgi:pyruvate,water dikinase